MARLVAALSGGVDSAVAAARLKEAGHDVTAVHLALMRNPALHRAGSRGCCSLEDANDARRVADVLGLPFYVWDLSERFQHDVVDDFLAEYRAGRTPNPCLRCNEKIKFAAMLERALALGFDGLATGHYAQIVQRPGGPPAAGSLDSPRPGVRPVAGGLASPPPGAHPVAGGLASPRPGAHPVAGGLDSPPPGVHPVAGKESWDGNPGPDSLYARTEGAPVELHRGVDQAKDQSYVLSVMTQEQLRHSWFPLGGSPKVQVRAEAAERGLRVADKPDSSDICFIPDGDTAGYLRDRLGATAGAVVDEGGQTVGAHQGAFAFTIGQRRGLRLGRPAADGQPRYVTRIDGPTVVVGPKSSLRVDRLQVGRPIWCGGEDVTGDVTVDVQFRAHGEPLPATIHVAGDSVDVDLRQPAFGVAPGQTAAFYVGPMVLGSGTIERTG